MGIVAAHRLKKMREFLAYQELATWRMNGFDRVVEGEESCFRGHCSLPPTHQEHNASLRHEFQKLKNAILMPNEEFVRRPVKKRGREAEELQQKMMDVVDGRRSDSLDELLANFEFAIIKEHVEKRSREAAQAQVTVTPVVTIQHCCSPCPPDPGPSPDVCVGLENNEGRMDPELEELESPSAGTGLKTPGQQCPPNEGIWEPGRTTASGILTAGVDSSQEGKIPSPTESVDSRADKSTRISADSTFLKQGHKLRREQNKQFDPGGKGEKAPPWNAAVTLLSFSGESLVAPCLFSVCTQCVVCAPFPKLLFSIQVTTSQRSSKA